MVDLVVTIGFYNAVVRVLASLEIDVEPDYQPYLDEFPLPAAGKGRNERRRSTASARAGAGAAGRHRRHPARRPRRPRGVHGGAPPRDRLRLGRAGVSGRQGRCRGTTPRPGPSLAPHAGTSAERAFVVAAARETFEEAGLVLARRRGSASPAERRGGARPRRAIPYPAARGDTTFLDLVRAEGLMLATDVMVPFAHWITPKIAAQALRHALPAGRSPRLAARRP